MKREPRARDALMYPSNSEHINPLYFWSSTTVFEQMGQQRKWRWIPLSPLPLSLSFLHGFPKPGYTFSLFLKVMLERKGGLLISVRIHSLNQHFPKPIMVISFPFPGIHLEADVGSSSGRQDVDELQICWVTSEEGCLPWSKEKGMPCVPSYFWTWLHEGITLGDTFYTCCHIMTRICSG